MKTIPKFSNYSITKGGRVWSHISNKWLKPGIDAYGYFKVVLYKHKKGFTRQVHRLVLEAYIEKRPKRKECCHFDGNRQNNKLSNLRWDTRQNNHKDAVKHGTHVGCRKGERHPSAKLSNKNVKTIIRKYKTGLFSQRKLAKLYGVCFTTINAVLTKRNWKHI